MPSDRTERTSAGKRVATPRAGQFLFLVLEGARLEAGGARIALSGVDELVIGRGEQRAIARTGERARALTVPDTRMSGSHARITRVEGVLRVADLGSTNGTLVNGAPAGHATLRDGDVLELGHSVFVFREIVEPSGGRAEDLDAKDLASLPAGFATLDPSLARDLERLVRVAASPLGVLLAGETGTGKEVLARGIHALSKRPGPFVAVNCGAIPANLVESHLFGHVKGAFSGAVRDELGHVRAAQFGTLLLDEIGDLPPPEQASLLRVLQEREVVPVGSAHAIKVDVRVVAATHKPLEQLVERGEFRKDLYARLAGYAFTAPPLRERRVDLGVIVASLVARGKVNAGGLVLHHEAARALLRYDWPMNIRELEQCLATTVVLAEEGAIRVEDLPRAVADALAAEHDAGEGPVDAEAEALKRELLAQMAAARGNVTEVAKAMGKARQQVQRWLRRFEIDPEAFRD